MSSAAVDVLDRVTPALPDGTDPRLADAIAGGTVVVERNSRRIDPADPHVYCARDGGDVRCRAVRYVVVLHGLDTSCASSTASSSTWEITSLACA
jgi:hypothetical protein